MRIGKYYRNREEKCISGGTGCGVVYLSGCLLHCAYCLVGEISQEGKGLDYTVEEAADLLLRLQGQGVSHISVANAEPQAEELIAVIEEARRRGLSVPLLNNFGGYAEEGMMRRLMPHFEGYVMDWKYADAAIGLRLSGIADYPKAAARCLAMLTEYYGRNRYDENGLLRSGVLLRHLILPGLPQNTEGVIRLLAQQNTAGYPLELMADFVPEWHTAEVLPPPYRIPQEVKQKSIALAQQLGLQAT